MPKVDYSNIKELDNSPIPKGTYDARFVKWELVEKSGKDPYYNCEFRLEGGDFHDRPVWQILSLSPRALWKFKQVMVRLGADAEDMAPESDVDTDEIIGAQVGAACRLLIEMESYPSNDMDEYGDPIQKERPVIKDVLAPALVI